jgi:hypothetical protein
LFNLIKRLSGLITIIFLVVVNAVFIEILLDRFGIKGHRLFTGILGVSLIAVSFGYSLRKRRLIPGSPRVWLTFHEWLAILGTFVLLVHTGAHFTALIPIITLILTLITFVSGLVGRYVYNNARANLKEKKAELKKDGLTDEEIDTRLWGLAIASKTLSRWRELHKPIVILLVIMAVYHATSALYYRGF